MGKIKCLQCGTILESKHHYDFQRCSCSNRTFVDGGDDYLRYGGKDMEKIEIIEDNTERSRQKDNLEEICEEFMEENQELFDALGHEKRDDLY